MHCLQGFRWLQWHRFGPELLGAIGAAPPPPRKESDPQASFPRGLGFHMSVSTWVGQPGLGTGHTHLCSVTSGLLPCQPFLSALYILFLLCGFCFLVASASFHPWSWPQTDLLASFCRCSQFSLCCRHHLPGAKRLRVQAWKAVGDVGLRLHQGGGCGHTAVPSSPHQPSLLPADLVPPTPCHDPILTVMTGDNIPPSRTET